MFRKLLVAFVGILFVSQPVFAKPGDKHKNKPVAYVINADVYRMLSSERKGQVIKQLYQTMVDLETAYQRSPKHAQATPGFVDRLQALRAFFMAEAQAADTIPRKHPGGPFAPGKSVTKDATCIYAGWSVKAELFGAADFCSEKGIPPEARKACSNTNEVPCNPSVFISDSPICVTSAFFLRSTGGTEFMPTKSCVEEMKRRYGNSKGEIDYKKIAEKIQSTPGGEKNFLEAMKAANDTCADGQKAKLGQPLKNDVTYTCSNLRNFSDGVIKELVEENANNRRNDRKLLVDEEKNSQTKAAGGDVSATAKADANMNITVGNLGNNPALWSPADIDDTAENVVLSLLDDGSKQTSPDDMPKTPPQAPACVAKDSKGRCCYGGKDDLPGKFYCKARIIDDEMPEFMKKGFKGYHIITVQNGKLNFFKASEPTGPFCPSEDALGIDPKDADVGMKKGTRLVSTCPEVDRPTRDYTVRLNFVGEGKGSALDLNRNLDTNVCNLNPDKKGFGFGGKKFGKLKTEPFIPGQTLTQIYDREIQKADVLAQKAVDTLKDRHDLQKGRVLRDRSKGQICGTQPLEIYDALKFYSLYKECNGSAKFKVAFSLADEAPSCAVNAKGNSVQMQTDSEQLDSKYNVYICSNMGGEPVKISSAERKNWSSGAYVQKFMNLPSESSLCGPNAAARNPGTGEATDSNQ